MTPSPFQLPNELFVSTICAQFPCREPQIKSLTTLLSSCICSPKDIVLHGLEATGKSSVTQAILSALYSQNPTRDGQETTHDGSRTGEFRYAIVKSAECITGRHLLETTIGEISRAVDWKGSVSRCESLAQLMVESKKLLEDQECRQNAEEEAHRKGKGGRKFVLVFDGIDRQKEAQPTLLHALARMGELIPVLTTIFIVTSPRPHFLHTTGVPHIHFPAYTKSEALQILSLDVPPIYVVSRTSSPASPTPKEEDTKSARESREVWTRFTSVVWDSLAKHAGRDILSFRDVCMKLWPSFTQPLRDGTYTPKDFSRLLVSKRALLQDERVFVPSITPTSSFSSLSTAPISAPKDPILKPNPSLITTSSRSNQQSQGITSQLPYTTRLLLVAAYLASYIPARTDTLLFMKSNAQLLSRRRKKSQSAALAAPRPGSSKHRKIARKLLGPQAFVAERMLAIFWALARNSDGGIGSRLAPGSADIPMAVATLASLRLVVKTSPAADVLDASTKWKVNVGWDVVRSVARSVGVEAEEYFWGE